MSGHQDPDNNKREAEREAERQAAAQSGPQDEDQPAASSSSSLFDPNYRGPSVMGQHGQQPYNLNASGRGYHNSQFAPAYHPAASRGRGYPAGRGAGGGRLPPTGPRFGAPYPPRTHQQAPVQQFPGRRTPPTGPRFQSRGPGRNPGQRGGQRPPVLSSANSRPVAPRHGRPAPTGPSASAVPRPFGNDDFPTLGKSQSRQPAPRQQPGVFASPGRQQARQAPEAQARPSSNRGRGRFVPFTDFNPSSAPPPESNRRQAATQPPPRRRRNPDFQVSLSECYRGKIIFIDDLPGLDYSGHPAIVRSIDPVTQNIKFFKKSSFKNIGGFMEKYGEYVNQSQKKWHEKQWLLVDDGSTKPHHGTPLLRLANGEKMPEKGSYVDIHGDTELHIDYFSKYSRFGIFPDLFLPEEEMRTLENYSRWYLGKDGEYREAEEKKKREKWQMDGSADVDIGDVYDDSENESAR